MFFRRKKNKRPKGQPEQRAHYRSELGSNHSLEITLEPPDRSLIPAELVNLTVRGAGVRVPAETATGLEGDDVLEVCISSKRDRWTIKTPAVVRQVNEERGHLSCGIEFINLGNLYSQMEDALGRYFNRRAHLRVHPHFDRPDSVTLSSMGNKMMGTVYDLTTHGLGIVLSHVEAAPLKLETEARVSLQLGRKKAVLDGPTVIRHRRKLSMGELVGVEFDLEHESGFGQHQKLLGEYCAKREREMAAWDSSFEGDAA
jgi:hypothetical protein